MNIIISLILSSLVAQTNLIEEHVFYLPDRESHLMPFLKRAANLANKSKECIKVTDATTSPSYSQPGYPVYFVTCENSVGLFFNVYKPIV